MLVDCIFVAIAIGLQVVASLPYPLLDHDPPIRIIKNVMGFIIL
jgi:hypothetical protein